jgi:hypothetical protein
MMFSMICGTSHNSSRLQIYDHVKLENPHELSRIPRRSKKSIILEAHRRSVLVKLMVTRNNHGYSCCIKKIIKNKLVATRSCEFGNYGKVVMMRRLNSQSG